MTDNAMCPLHLVRSQQVTLYDICLGDDELNHIAHMMETNDTSELDRLSITEVVTIYDRVIGTLFAIDSFIAHGKTSAFLNGAPRNDLATYREQINYLNVAIYKALSRNLPHETLSRFMQATWS